MMCYLCRILCTAPLLPLILTGCSKGNIVKVTGVLTYKGSPLTNAYIHFEEEHGRERMCWAQTDEQGRFKVNYDKHQDGIVVGKYRIWIERRPVTVAEKEAAQIHGLQSAPAGELVAFYAKYGSEKSTLTREITHDTRELILTLD